MLLNWLYLFISVSFAQTDVVVIDNFTYSKSHGYQVLQVLKEDNFQANIIKLEESNYLNSLKKAIHLKPLVLNLSFGSTDYNSEELALLKELSSLGTIIVVASGNNNQQVNRHNPIYPCFYPVDNLICVGASDGESKSTLSNFGSRVKVFTSGLFNGDNVTSFAVPRVSRFIVQALKCNLNPLELIQSQSINIHHQSQSLITYPATDFCYNSPNGPF